MGPLLSVDADSGLSITLRRSNAHPRAVYEQKATTLQTFLRFSESVANDERVLDYGTEDGPAQVHRLRLLPEGFDEPAMETITAAITHERERGRSPVS